MNSPQLKLPTQLKLPINVLRLSLHPAELIRAHHQSFRVASASVRQIEPSNQNLRQCSFNKIKAGIEKLTQQPETQSIISVPGKPSRQALPFRFGILINDSETSFLSTAVVFGTPLDVTLSKLAIESFSPADAATAAYLSQKRNDNNF